MKILIATPYIYDKQWPEFTRNKTGFGIMVNDIFKSMANKETVYLISHVVTKGHGDRILKHTLKDILYYSKPRDWMQGILWFFKYRQNIKGRVQYFYYCINKGYIRKVLKKLKPDIVHIHGLNCSTKTYMEVCEELNVPYAITLHGLIGLNDSITASEWDKAYEKEFLSKADKDKIKVTVISSGMKKRIENNYLHHKADNIFVITNGTKIPFDSVLLGEKLNLRKKYNLQDDCKIGILVGTICNRNNQIQIIEAVNLLSEEDKQKCAIFLCGNDCMNGHVQQYIQNFKLQNRVFVLDYLTNDVLNSLFEQVNFNIITSKDEGFGVSIIEANSHGLPTVTFSDNLSAKKLYDEKTMIMSKNRSSKNFAEALRQILCVSWDKEYIKNFSVQIALEDMATKYENDNYSIIKQGGFPPLELTYDYIRIKKKFGSKILVYVGNITDNKNQLQAVRIMEKIENAILIILGRECDGGKVRNYIIENNLTAKVVLAGFCDDIDQVWINTDLNMFLSKNDGFGLSIIEGFMRGVPSVIFDDLDAFNDVNANSNIIPVCDRDDDSVIYNVKKALLSEWNIEDIQREATSYSVGKMAEQYIDVLGR